MLWIPASDPQWFAYVSGADELFYGGAAGGGKSDLLLGLATTAHLKSIIFRRELTQLKGPSGLIERSREIIGKHGRYNGQEFAWRDLPNGRSFEFGACQYDRDKHRYQGRPHDLIGFDEISEFLESMYRFLIGWLRTTVQGQRCRVVATGNPPSHSDGQWVLDYWAPWLDEHHRNPALPGELRWFAMIDGKDQEVDGPATFEHEGEIVQPKSRTFIPARLSDNPYLAETSYGRILNNLPEPLRSQLLYGDFTVGMTDDPWQVIPTAWVRAANQRWRERGQPETPLTCLGVDVARGGADSTVLARRFDNWFAELEDYPGSETPDGPTVGAKVMTAIVDNPLTPINVDIIGVGTSVFDWLAEKERNAIAVNFSSGTNDRDRSGMLAMRNVRAASWWGMREALDPIRGDDIALPPDKRLMADLVAPKWKISASGIQIESKEDIKGRLGRSTDYGDAVVLANYTGLQAWIMAL